MNELRINEANIADCIRDGRRLEYNNHQASIYVGTIQGCKVLIKAVMATGATAHICRWMLRREHRAYQALAGLRGIPHCYGFFQGRFLVLDYVESHTMRHAAIVNRATFFDELKSIIESMHERNVCHGDLKRKENILVIDGERPCMIDFGVASIRKRGLHPINHLWHSYALQHDFNAWIKHKYAGQMQYISPQDARYYRPMRIEMIARWSKQRWTGVKNGFKGAFTNSSAR